MIRHIQTIKQHIRRLQDDHDEPAEQQWDTFSQQMTAIETELYAQFKEGPDRNAIWDVRNFHEELVQLIDQHTPPNETCDTTTPLLKRLLETLSFSEQKFQVSIDPEKSVPLVYERNIRQLILTQQPVVIRALRDKQVNPVLIDKLGHGFSLLLGQPLAAMAYATYRYFLLFLPALLELSLSKLQKDWNLRLFRFFIQYNFNHMGIYNWWQHETEQALRKLKPLDAMEHLYKLITHIEAIDQKTDLRYEQWREPLKTKMLAYLNRCREMLNDKEQLLKDVQSHVLIRHEPIDEQNIRFHDDFEQGIYKAYKSKEEASEAYVHVIRGPEGQELSPASLRKSDKTKYYGAADRVLEKLEEQQQRIRERFPAPASNLHRNRYS